MGTYAAQLLMGTSHPYHHGIHPAHALYFNVNSRCAWVLENYPPGTGQDKVWIPCPESIMETAVLMIATYCLKDETITEFARKHFKKDPFGPDILALYEDIAEKDLGVLFDECLRIHKKYDYKLILSIFREGVGDFANLEVLKQYDMELEICRPVYTRLHSPTGGNCMEEGSLEFRYE